VQFILFFGLRRMLAFFKEYLITLSLKRAKGVTGKIFVFRVIFFDDANLPHVFELYLPVYFFILLIINECYFWSHI
jgi:hypothetical protein